MRNGAVAIVFGTRPELVKLAPLLWELGPAAVTVHVGQHSAESLAPIRTDLGLRAPTVTLAVPAAPRGRQIGEAVVGVTGALAGLRPDVVVVQGDTNSTLAAAIAATSVDLPLVHVEAGLRAFDRALPEERNRIVVDHLADLLAAPTETARAHLLAEGIPDARIVVTGNTVVDAAHRCAPDETDRRAVLRRLGVEPDDFVLATFHRPENVDDPERLAGIVAELAAIPVPVILPVHPRTRDRAAHAGVALDRGSLRTVDPLGYREFLALEAECALLVTDSGGVQEEASIVGRPALVVRRSTERPEVVGTFTTMLPAGAHLTAAATSLLADRAELHDRLVQLPTPYGDGGAAARIVAAIGDLRPGPPHGDRRYDAPRGRHDGSVPSP